MLNQFVPWILTLQEPVSCVRHRKMPRLNSCLNLLLREPHLTEDEE